MLFHANAEKAPPFPQTISAPNYLCNFNIPLNSESVNSQIITILQMICDFFVHSALKRRKNDPKSPFFSDFSRTNRKKQPRRARRSCLYAAPRITKPLCGAAFIIGKKQILQEQRFDSAKRNRAIGHVFAEINLRDTTLREPEAARRGQCGG